MTTLTEKDYAFSFYTEVTGNWTAPDRCHEALLIASGGGGGGSSPSGYKVAPLGAYPVGTAGGNGGDTEITGSFGSLVFAGGAGGAGHAATPAPQQGIRTGNSGQSSGGFNPAPTEIPVSAGAGTDGQKGARAFFSSSMLMKKGGDGGDRGYNITDTINNVNIFQSASGESGDGINGGRAAVFANPQGQATAATNITTTSNGASGGAGGSAVGVKKKIKVQAGEVISITIGSGGNGGASSATNQPSVNAPGRGGGGAGGFAAIFWNED